MTRNSKPQIVFQSYNPYEARYPGLRVVSRESLHLMKILRSNGYKIVVEPQNGTKLCYLAEKGIKEFLSDPIIALAINASLSLLINLLSNWIYDHLKRKPKDDEINLVLEVNENGQKVRYNHSGQPISDEKFQSILALMSSRAKQYRDSLSVQPPDLFHFYPIYLEHTPQIVGWAEKVVKDNKGLMLEGVKITDEQTKLRIECDDLIGFSVGGIIQKSTCFICKKDYVACNHITGQIYDGKECVVRIDKILIADFSVVKILYSSLPEYKRPASIIKRANTAYTGQGYHPTIRSALCKVWRDNV